MQSKYLSVPPRYAPAISNRFPEHLTQMPSLKCHSISVPLYHVYHYSTCTIWYLSVLQYYYRTYSTYYEYYE
jgi:hypothetical protein